MSKVTMLLYYVVKNVKEKRKVNKHLTWYDSSETDASKRLKHYQGGQLKYRYDYKTKRPYVEVVDLEESVNKKISNEHDIKEWCSNRGFRYGIEINDEESNRSHLAIDIDVNVKSLIEHELDNIGIKYDYL